MLTRLKDWLFGTLRRQLTVGMAVLVTAIMLVLVQTTVRHEQQHVMYQQTLQAQALAQSVAAASTVWLASRDFAGLQEIVEGLRDYPDMSHAIVLDMQGLVLAHGDAMRRGLYLGDLPAEAQTTILQRTETMVDAASPVMLGGKPIGWVRIGLGSASLVAEIAAVRRQGLGYALLAIVISVAFAAFVGRLLSRRLQAIQQVADAVQAGDTGVRVRLPGDDEAARLGEAFDAMLDTLARRESALSTSERKLTAILDNVTAYIYLKDLQGCYIYANRLVRELFQADLDEIVGQDDGKFFDAATFSQLQQNDQRVLRGGETLKTEENNVDLHSGKLATYLTVKLPLRDENGKIYALCGISTDITERKQAELLLARHKDELETEVKLRTADLILARDAAEAANRAKSTFLANMSHELRTPMNAIMGMTDLVLRHASDPKQIDQLGKVMQASNHLLQVINDILDISKIEAERMTLEKTGFTLGEALENLASLTGHKAAEKGLKLLIDLEEDLPMRRFNGDPLRLGQILLNLTGNALKFTERGSITVRVRRLEDNPEDVLLRIEVADTGIGIDAVAQARLFTAFEQADGSMTRKYGGTGLGLAISKRLVQMMGGEIGVESQPGVGSTFWFTVRLNKASGNAVAPAPTFTLDTAETRLRAGFAGCRILLAEDEPINQEVSRGLLEDAGLAVDLAADGQQAVAMARQNRYALVLMDMQMPVMNGVEATQAIRADSPNRDTPILAMTANAFDEDRRGCLDAGMNDHITKPVDPQRLYETLLRWMSPPSA